MNEQKTAENPASSIMNIIVESKKYSDYYECTDKKVFKFEDKKYLKQTCKRIFGEFVIYIYLNQKILYNY